MLALYNLKSSKLWQWRKMNCVIYDVLLVQLCSNVWVSNIL